MARDILVLRDEAGAEHQVDVLDDGTVGVDGRLFTVTALRPAEYRIGDRIVWAVANGDERWVFVDGREYTFVRRRARVGPRRPTAHHADALFAPMPATVIGVAVSAGQHVRAGDAVIILEAMKMELPVRAPADGVVLAVHCRTGELVQPGQELIEITPDPEPSTAAAADQT